MGLQHDQNDTKVEAFVPHHASLAAAFQPNHITIPCPRHHNPQI